SRGQSFDVRSQLARVNETHQLSASMSRICAVRLVGLVATEKAAVTDSSFAAVVSTVTAALPELPGVPAEPSNAGSRFAAVDESRLNCPIHPADMNEPVAPAVRQTIHACSAHSALVCAVVSMP